MFDKDSSRVGVGNIPQLMSFFGNIVIGLMRLRGITNIAESCHKFSSQPQLALELLGIEI